MDLIQIDLDTNVLYAGLRSRHGVSFKLLKQKESVSMNQFITLAVNEKVSTLLTVDYLKERAQRGDRKTFEQLREKVPDTEREEFDKL